MYYHLHIEYDGKVHQLWNQDLDSLVQKYILPFMNRHEILLERAEGSVFVNTNTVSSIIAYKTEILLEPQPGHVAPKGLGTAEFKHFACTQEILAEVRRSRVSDPLMRSILLKATSRPENKAFVIMKFNDNRLTSLHDNVIAPTFDQFGLAVERMDRRQDAGPISYEMLESIATSRLVLADLTGSRPNCYYETGFAHALGKELILTAREGERIHFNLNNYRFLTWQTENDMRIKLIARLTAIFRGGR